MNSIDHEHEFKTLEKSYDQLKMLKCNDLTLNHKCIYFNFCFLFFTLFQFTGFYLYTTYRSCKQCHMKHVGIVYISGRSLLLSGYLVMFKAFFPLASETALVLRKELSFCVWVCWSSGSVSERRAWGIKMPKLEEREEVGYPHEPTFSDRQPRLPLHRQYTSDLRRVCINKIKGFWWNLFTGPSTRALAGTEGKEGIS